MFARYFYITSSFAAGFALMTLELVSARLIAPIVGSSVFTWTSVIGITLLGLSLGAYAGGVFADKYKSNPTLGLAFLASSFFVFLVPILSTQTSFLEYANLGILTSVLLLSTYLFLLPSFVIGTLQPIILKMYADSFTNIGKEYGLLSAMWSLGSILGVFMTGFYFVAVMGSTTTLYIVSAILSFFGIYFLLEKNALMQKNAMRIGSSIATAVAIFFIGTTIQEVEASGNTLLKDETPYYLAQVIDAEIPGVGPGRALLLDFDFHSVEYDEDTTPPPAYTTMGPVFKAIRKDASTVHAIGGGAYTIPKHLLEYYPEATITVTEIDQEVTEIAKNYFELTTDQITPIAEDARTYFKKTSDMYDLIIGDAYSSFISIPWHLTTLEFTQDIKNHLDTDGIYAVNVVSALTGERASFFESLLTTFQKVFPHYYMFAFGTDPRDIQNIVLMGINNTSVVDIESLRKLLEEMPSTRPFAHMLVDGNLINMENSIVLTDDYAPVETLLIPTMKQYFPGYREFYREVIKGS